MRLSEPASALDVERAYRLVLGRDPESHAAIADKEGYPLGELVALFTNSSEFAGHVAPALSRNTNAVPLGRFQRPLTPAEAEWAQSFAAMQGMQLGQNATPQDVVYALSGLARPHMRTVTLDHADIANLYRLLLGRIPESQAVTYRGIGETAREAVANFVGSEEFADRIVSPLLLGGEPESDLRWEDVLGELVAWGAASLSLDETATAQLKKATSWPQAMNAVLDDVELRDLVDPAAAAAIRAWDERLAIAADPILSALDRPVQAVDVENAYALILGREVEQGPAIEARLGHPLHDLVTELLGSQEFREAVLLPLLLDGRCGRPGHGSAVDASMLRWASAVFGLDKGMLAAPWRIGLLASALRRRALDPRFSAPEPRLLAYAADKARFVGDAERRRKRPGVVVPSFSTSRRRHVDRLLSATEREQTSDALRALRLLDSGLFDPDHYRRTYSDVAVEGMDEVEHYLDHGDAEGRTPNRLFEPHAYRAKTGGRSSPTALERYISTGGADAPGYGSPEALRKQLYGRSPISLTWADRRAGLGKVVYEAARPFVLPRPPFSGEIIFAGPLNVASGLGTSARGYWKALAGSGLKVRAHAWTEGFEHQRQIGDFESLDEIKDGSILILHLNLDLISGMSDKTLRLMERSAYVIGIFYWELSVLYPEWLPWLRRFDEVWCPSTFIRDTLTAAAPIDAKMVRPWLELSSPVETSSEVSPKPYFFYMFDAGSGLGRKNPRALVEAYAQEFKPEDGFELVLKAGHVDESSAAWRSLVASTAERTDIRVLREHMSVERLSAYVREALAYVSPHRSEGLGLTIIEAQAQGVPVIATGWGGARDFTLHQSATVLSHGMVEVGEGNAPYMSGALWADPDIGAIRRALRTHATTDMRASGIVDAARLLVHDMFGPANAHLAHDALSGAMAALRP